MTLVWWELKKILRRRLTKVLLGLCLALVVAESVSLGFANLGFGEDVKAPTWEARTRIVQATRDAAAWHGPLTAEVLLAARDDCRERLAGTGTMADPETFVQGNILYLAATALTAEGYITWPDWPAQVTALDDETLTGLYALWDSAVERDIQNSPEAWQPPLQALKAQVNLPFVYDWVEGHYGELSMMDNLMFLVGLLLCAAVAPVFCAEVRTRVYTISHCARYGRGRLAAAKAGAALLFAGGGFAALMGVFVAIQIAMFGVRGLSASVQVAAFHCLLPLTLGQTEALLLLCGLVSCLAGAAITAALSARMENEFPVLLCLFGVLVFLRALATGGLLSGVPNAVVQTLPFLTHLGDLTGNTMITLPGGQALLIALYRLATQPLYLVVLLPLAWRAYVRRQVR